LIGDAATKTEKIIKISIFPLSDKVEGAKSYLFNWNWCNWPYMRRNW